MITLCMYHAISAWWQYTPTINAPINVKPHLPPPGHRWGFLQLVVQRTHPRGNYFLQYPSLDAHSIPWGNVEICICIMLFEFQYNYKIPTSGEYISDRRRTNPDLWGVGLDIDRCIIPSTDVNSSQATPSETISACELRDQKLYMN